MSACGSCCGVGSLDVGDRMAVGMLGSGETTASRLWGLSCQCARARRCLLSKQSGLPSGRWLSAGWGPSLQAASGGDVVVCVANGATLLLKVA